jgi:hypothetical protein
MRSKPIRRISKRPRAFIFGALLFFSCIAFMAGPASARNEKINFSETSGREFEQGSENLDVPYVTTPMAVVHTLLKLGSIGPNDFLIDLGSGDGRIVITAAKAYGARGFGVDLNEKLVSLSKKYAIAEGVDKRTNFFMKDIFKTDIQAATIVTMYLLNEVNLEMRPKLLKELKPGTRIVSHDFHMGSWRPDKMVLLDHRKYYRDDTILYLWTVPAMVAGQWQWDLFFQGRYQSFDLEIEQYFQDIKGEAYGQNQKVFIFNSLLTGDQIRFSLVSAMEDRMLRQDYQGRIRGDIIEGTVKLSGTVDPVTLKWRATRVWREPTPEYLQIIGPSNGETDR